MINKGLFAAWAIAAVATAWSFHADACEITWDTPADVGWLEGIRFFRDGAEIGTAAPTPPVACDVVGVQPCATCVYTARFFRQADESPDSNPLAVTIQGVPQFGTITIQAQ
jgi:hypothetical protein